MVRGQAGVQSNELKPNVFIIHMERMQDKAEQEISDMDVLTVGMSYHLHKRNTEMFVWDLINEI